MSETAIGKSAEATKPTESDESIVEAYAEKMKCEGEVPFFSGRKFSKKLWGDLFRINWFDPKTEHIRSQCVSIEDGVIEPR